MVIAIALCTYLGFGMVTVVLPVYVTNTFHGGALTVSVVVGIYSFAAVLARPWAGRFGDRHGRRLLMIVGPLIISASFALAAVAPTLGFLIVLRLVTGTGEGMFYTGSATLVTDLVPSHRRAEAVGYYSVALYLGTGLGPTIGHTLAQAEGIPAVFLLAAGLAALGSALSSRLPNPKVAPSETARPVLSRPAVVPGLVLFLGIMGLVAFQAYVPLYSADLHMVGPQYVFLLYSAVVCGVRMLGSWVHRFPFQNVARVAILLIVAGLALIASVPSPIVLYIGAAIFACGVAVQFPALMGLALSRAPDQDRASVVGTYTAFMDLAQGVGGFVLGVPAAAFGYRAGFASGAVSAFAGFGLLGRFAGKHGPLRRQREDSVVPTVDEAPPSPGMEPA